MTTPPLSATKAVKVTNVDVAASAKVNWKDASGYHDVILAPGEIKIVDPIVPQTAVKVTAVSGPVSVEVENVSAAASVTDHVAASVSAPPGDVKSYLIAGGYDNVSID